MRKVLLLIGALLLSLNAIASSDLPNEISSAIKNAMHNSHPAIKNTKASFAFIYGGQDISRPQIATADESVWSRESSIIG